jgi:hypothetical protein
MKNKIEYIPVNIENSEDYLNDAVRMVIVAYNREREFIPFLPDDDFNECFRGALKQLFTECVGAAAIDENGLDGFLAGIPVDKFHGTHPGVYCPVYGHGTVEENRIELYRGLYH